MLGLWQELGPRLGLGFAEGWVGGKEPDGEGQDLGLHLGIHQVSLPCPMLPLRIALGVT